MKRSGIGIGLAGLALILASTAPLAAQQMVDQGVITPGQTLQNRLQSGQEHVYILELSSGQEVDISLERRSGDIDPYLELRTMNDGQIDSNDDGGRGLNSRLRRYLDAGRYRLVAREFGRDDSGDYEISVNGAGSGTPVSGIPVAIGQSVSSYINDGEPQTFTLQVPQAQRLRIEMIRDGSFGIDPYLELGDEFGNVIASDDDGAGSLNSRITYYLEPGRYTLTAYDLGDNSSGGFALRVESMGSGAVQGIPVEVGQTVDSYISNGEPQYFTLSLPAPQALRIDMESTGGGGIDPYLVLGDAFGNEIESDDDGGSGFNSRITRQLQAGDYTLIARDLGNNDTGAFRLTVADRGEVSTTGIPIVVGQTVESYLTDGQEQPFILTVDERATVVMELQRGDDSRIDPHLTLENSSGVRIESDDDGGSGLNSRISRQLDPGTYRLVARDLGNNSSGSFRLVVTSGMQANAIPIRPGQAYDGFLNPGQRFVYGLSLQNGQEVTIDFSRTGNARFDPYLMLHDGAGNQIASDDDGGSGLDSRLRRYLDAGTYLIEVSDRGGDAGGSFRISVE
jgi:hypothetical protein